MKAASQQQVAANFADYLKGSQKGPVVVTDNGEPTAGSEERFAVEPRDGGADARVADASLGKGTQFVRKTSGVRFSPAACRCFPSCGKIGVEDSGIFVSCDRIRLRSSLLL